jgi:hypothetical protein
MRSHFFQLDKCNAELLWRLPGMAEAVVQFPGIVDAPLLCVRLPVPFAALVATEVWPRFCLPEVHRDGNQRRETSFGWGHWPGLKEAFGATAARHPERVILSEADSSFEGLMAPRQLQAMADDLRRWAPAIVDADADLHGGAAAQSQVESWIRRLQRAHDEVVDWQTGAFNMERGAARRRSWGNRQPFKVQFLVECVLLSGLLHVDGSLKQALQGAVRLCLPPHVANVVSQTLDNGSLQIPSGSTISRRRLMVDVAYMMHRRALNDKFGRGAVRYIMVDSSPQGGRDYELVVVTSIAGPCLLQAFRDARCLTQRCYHHKMCDEGL